MKAFLSFVSDREVKHIGAKVNEYTWFKTFRIFSNDRLAVCLTLFS